MTVPVDVGLRFTDEIETKRNQMKSNRFLFCVNKNFEVSPSPPQKCEKKEHTEKGKYFGKYCSYFIKVILFDFDGW